MTRVYVSIGSNLEPVRHIHSGVAMLEASFAPVTCSPVYTNPAVGFVGEDFYNLVVGFDTDLDVTALSARLREIEHAHGRHRGDAKFAPRTLDLDLLTYGEQISERPGLTLPRPDILRYPFVLKPLADIAPHAYHPVTGQTYAELWQQQNIVDADLVLSPNFFVR
jgi:2-amino-4-hydroxy-6-hydroxymethyldihydropteridine diphosphokinase